MSKPENLSIGGREVPPDLVGSLSVSAVEDDLRTRLDADGYLFIRNAIDTDRVQLACDFVLQQLASVDEIEIVRSHAVATGRSRRRRLHSNLGRFWQQVSQSPQLRQCVHATSLYELTGKIFSEPVRPFDFVWLRAFAGGGASPLHIDHPYMNRGTHRVLSCWIPLVNVSIEGGALFIVENSNRIRSLRDQFESHDVDLDKSRPGYIDVNAIEFAQQHDRRLLSSSFCAGDILLFDHFTAHAAFDNHDPAGRVRISCDTRWQPAAEPMDERFRGPDPSAHDGLGYACLSAARPLTETTTRR